MAIEVEGQHPINVFSAPIGYDQVGSRAVDGVMTAGQQANSVGGSQLVPNEYYRRSIIDILPYMDFQQIASSIKKAKYSGKTMHMYHYLPVIDDRNKNDQGIGADGLLKANGNMWGSTRDPSKIIAGMPLSNEYGGRINRIGFTREVIQSEMRKYSFFFEYSEDELDFDTDKDLYNHMTSLSIEAANKVLENLIAIDLMSKAGIKIINGSIDDDGKVVTEIKNLTDADVLTYKLFHQMDMALNEVRCPTDTRMITGSRNIDTQVIPNARVAFIPPELTSDIEDLVGNHGKPAFVGVEHYAAAGKVLNNEWGKVGNFRLIRVQEMPDAGLGADAANAEFYAADNRYRVFPLLVVGKDSFNTITFHNSGNGSSKFRIIAKKPGFQMADRHNPTGEIGFWSARFWYGMLVHRPDRIACAYVTAKI